MANNSVYRVGVKVQRVNGGTYGWVPGSFETLQNVTIAEVKNKAKEKFDFAYAHNPNAKVVVLQYNSKNAKTSSSYYVMTKDTWQRQTV